jgi:hypothetical protein
MTITRLQRHFSNSQFLNLGTAFVPSPERPILGRDLAEVFRVLPSDVSGAPATTAGQGVVSADPFSAVRGWAGATERSRAQADDITTKAGAIN